jgi:hypothetical protein
MEASVDPDKFLGLSCKQCKSGKMEAWRDDDNSGPLIGTMPKVVNTVKRETGTKPIQKDRHRDKKQNKRRKRKQK